MLDPQSIVGMSPPDVQQSTKSRRQEQRREKKDLLLHFTFKKMKAGGMTGVATPSPATNPPNFNWVIKLEGMIRILLQYPGQLSDAAMIHNFTIYIKVPPLATIDRD